MQTYRNASNKHPRRLFTFWGQGGALIRGGANLKGALIQNPPKILNQISFFLNELIFNTHKNETLLHRASKFDKIHKI